MKRLLYGEIQSTPSMQIPVLVREANKRFSEIKRTVSLVAAQEFVVTDFGARGNGLTDDWQAVSDAVSAAREVGGVVYFPPGQYYIDTDSNGSIDVYDVALIGSGVGDGSNSSGPTTGSWIYIKGTTSNAAFGMHANLTVQGLGFWYTNQTDSSTPNAHAPTFQGLLGVGTMNFVRFQDCTFLNSYIAIDFNVDTSVGFVWIDKCSIYGIHRAIRTNGNNAVCKITNCSISFVAMLDASESGLRQYTRASGVGIEFENGSDGMFIEHCQFLGYNKCISYDTGQCGAQHIVNCEFGQTLNAIYIGSSAYLVQSIVAMSVFFCFNSEDSTDIGYALNFDSPSDADDVTIIGCRFAQTSGSHIKYTNSASDCRLLIEACNFHRMAYQQSSGSYGALEIDAASAGVMFLDNRVTGQANAYASGILVTDCGDLTVTGNVFRDCNEALSVTACDDLYARSNTSYSTVASNSDAVGTISGVHIQNSNQWDKPKVYTVTAAATITVPSGPLVRIANSGTAIDNITAHVDGTPVYLMATGAVTFNDTSTAAGNLVLSGSANYSAGSTDTLHLISDGTNYNEMSRSNN